MALASPRLQRLAQRPAGSQPQDAARAAGSAQAQLLGGSAQELAEHCELCGQPIPPEHRHVLDLDDRNLLCACRACALLFERQAAGGGHFRLVPERRLRLDRLALPDDVWERLRIPVDMAFFFHNTSAGRVVAYYPSPMGPTESELELGAWDELEAANPVLGTLVPDVEALLVNRARGVRRQWLVPIEDCYALVAVIRTHWRGFSGGRQVWDELEHFYAELDRKSKPAPDGAAERRP